jgi:ABC-2 type transport system ATP-binding protein
VGELAASLGIALHGLSSQQLSLEDAFMAITRSAVEYRMEAESADLRAVA